MDNFKDKYRDDSLRMQKWDYGWAADYFVTICTSEKECFFGEVVNGVMELSPVGTIADVFWYEIKNHAINVELGEFVVMPNHVHGIIILNENPHDATKSGGSTKNVGTRHALSLLCIAPTLCIASLPLPSIINPDLLNRIGCL